MYGQQLLALAKLLGLTQTAIAAQLGVPRSHVHRWAHGQRRIPDHHAARLQEYVEAAIVRYWAAQPPPEASARVTQAMALLAKVVQTEWAQGPARPSASLDDILTELATFRALPLTALMQPAYAARLHLLGAFLQRYAEIVSTLGPLLLKESPDALTDSDGHEAARPGTPRADPAHVGALAHE